MVTYDLVIRNGTIVDGTGEPAFTGSVAILGDTIAAVGEIDGQGRREIDAKDHIITPGFVDAHTHLDAQIAWDPTLTPVTQHGVTTALLGNCGFGFAPCRPGDRQTLADMMESVEDIPANAIVAGLPWNWTSYGEYLDALSVMRPTINVAGLVGHCAIRMFVMGERSVDDQATDADMAEMLDVVRRSLDEGAVGFSTSRILSHKMSDGRYVPGTFAGHEELVRISRLVGSHGALMQFVPNYNALDDEMDLIHKSAKASGSAVLFSTGASRPDDGDTKIIWALELMRAEELDVTGMMVPRGSGRVTGLQTVTSIWKTPLWQSLDDMTFEQRLDAINKPEFAAALVAEAKQFGPSQKMDQVFWLGAGPRPDYTAGIDSKLLVMAERAGEDPAETYLRITRESEGRALFVIRSLNPESDKMVTMLSHDSILPGLGDAGAHVAIVMDGSWPTFVLGHWIRDIGLYSLEDGIRRMTSAPAKLIGQHDRGLLKVGYKADLNVIDLERIAEDMPMIVHDFPFNAPRFKQSARGYRATVCNGLTVLENDELTGERAGHVLRGAVAA